MADRRDGPARTAAPPRRAGSGPDPDSGPGAGAGTDSGPDADSGSGSGTDSGSGVRARNRTRSRARKGGPEDAAEQACDSLARLIGHPAEGASAVCLTENGWRVDVDVLEVARIPDTTSLLATYAVDLDEDGALRGYRRIRRYRRGAADQ